MAKETDVAIELALEIGTLRERLRSKEAQLAALRNGHGPMPEVDRDSGGLRSGSLPSRVVELLQSVPSKVFDATRIAKALSVPNVNNVRGVLVRLNRSERIQKVSRGRYRIGHAESTQ